MFKRIIRDSTFGRLLYRVSGRRVLKHKEEYSSYVAPAKYILETGDKKGPVSGPRVESMNDSSTTTICEKEAEKTAEEYIIVTWDGEDDPENPYNWPLIYKAIFIAKISLLTTFVYMASAIYTPGVDLIMEQMHVSRVKATLPLSLFRFRVSAPSFGPIIGAGLISDSGSYHWPFWFVCIVSGVLFITLSVFLPESSTSTLLYRKAERLRALTGNYRIVSQGHLDLGEKDLHTILTETFWRPFEIMIFEPVVLLINIYLGLIYAILYLWFEAFPIVFYETYGFSLVGMGASYMSQILGLLIGACVYLPIIYHRFTKKLLAGETLAPEVHLPVCIYGSLAMSLGMIVFAWTSTPSVHWIAPMIGAGAFMFGAFFAYQTLFNYLGMSFYRYLASVFAGNIFLRAIMGGAFPLFGRSLFVNLATNKYPVAWGTNDFGHHSTHLAFHPDIVLSQRAKVTRPLEIRQLMNPNLSKLICKEELGATAYFS
ncbi:hypothetical protein HF325_006544 [Metschnikowia pulcherrima]|uniref:Uncharacterized protein n=1 Tax=Metschnikowia pulcherrima TaxID=27326 RepID=A0A8H7GL51_9ASCO|nr:hypothetical protein HF325_006544 [Metschnikowia pulcherrima]